MTDQRCRSQGLAIASILVLIAISSQTLEAAGTSCVTFSSTSCDATGIKQFDQILLTPLKPTKGKQADTLTMCSWEVLHEPKTPYTGGCFLAADGPYKGVCCCVGPNPDLITVCEAKSTFPKDGLSWAPVNQVTFTKVKKFQRFTMKDPTSAVSLSKYTLSPSKDVKLLEPIVKDIDIIKKPEFIELDPLMTLFPPENHEKVFVYRLHKLSTSNYPEIKHQASVLHDLLAETKSSWSWKLLHVINTCIANLHAADKTRKFIDDGNKLIPLYTAVGDHFFADSLVVHLPSVGESKRNAFNAFKYNPHQIIGQEDPREAVSFITSKLPKELTTLRIVELMLRSFTLDMSAWARLYSKEMRLNPALHTDDVKQLYKHIQNEITVSLKSSLMSKLNY